MEKENYETYEYLPASGSNSESEPYQFFVVQDDGTFLINRQVQYVTEVQAEKEAPQDQPCAILDVAPQQFYVDIDPTTEMISVPEQFNIPEGSSNLYANNYLLQPGAGTPVEQMDNHVPEQIKATLQEESSLPEANKQTNSLTEITITDDQYQMLEQKGWVLLETNGKNYVLDTFGLHDITTNDKLIQKLKTEETTPNLQPDTRESKPEHPSSLDSINVEIPTEVQKESKLETPTEAECASDLSPIVAESKEEVDQKPTWDEKKITSTTDASHATVVDNLYNGVCEKWQDGNVLRIRTDFCLKDIPDKIFLGKTKNGKRLVCKVMKPAKDVKRSQRSKAEPTAATVQNSIPPDLTDVGDFDDDKLKNVLKVCFEESSVNCSPGDVTFAERVVMQLLRLPAVKPTLEDRNLILTKVIANEKKSSIVKSSPTLVTGTVSNLGNEWRFLHKPDLHVTAKQEISQKQTEDGTDHNFLYMHIHQIQRDDKVIRTAVALNELFQKADGQDSEKIFIPDLPLHWIPEANTENTVYYACGACAGIFQSEMELNKHRETHKMDMDNKLKTNKEENVNKTGILVLQDPGNKSKKYTCIQCNAKFRRLNNCQRHVKIHMAPVENESSGDKKKIYECNICYSLFHHAPTLQRHIMRHHIKVNK